MSQEFSLFSESNWDISRTCKPSSYPKLRFSFKKYGGLESKRLTHTSHALKSKKEMVTNGNRNAADPIEGHLFVVGWTSTYRR